MERQSEWDGLTMTSEATQPADSNTESTMTVDSHGSKPPKTGAVHLELLTESRGQVARRCLREEKLRYVDGIVPLASADALRFGTLWHHGQEAWWLAVCDGEQDRLPFALQALRAHAADMDPFELARCEAMMIGYDARWRDESPFEVIGVELEFRAPLINPETGAKSRTFERAGKLDVLARRGLNTLVIEHKTSSEDIMPGSSWWSRLRMGGQAAGYLRGAEALGHHPDGVMYDVARKPALKPLQANKQRAVAETPEEFKARCLEAIAEEPDKYFQRGLVVRLEEQMAEADKEAWLLALTLRDHHRLGLAPRNTDACQRYSQTCSYFPLCSGEAEIDGPHFKRLDWKHPELTEMNR